MRVGGVGLCGSDRHWFLEGGIGDAVLERAARPRPRVRRRRRRRPTCRRARRARPGGAVRPLRALPARGTGTSAPTCVSPGTVRRTARCGRSSRGPTVSSIRSRTRSRTRRRRCSSRSAVALHALDLGGAAAGSTAAVFGCGPLGLLLVQALRAAGPAGRAGRRPLPHRVAAARALGARSSEPAGIEVDVAFEVAGDDDALDDAIAAARPGGRVVLVGIPDGDRTSFHAAAARRKGLTLALLPTHARERPARGRSGSPRAPAARARRPRHRVDTRLADGRSGVPRPRRAARPEGRRRSRAR